MAKPDERIVYIVDDDADVRDSTMELLHCTGLAVETFTSGRAFLDTFDPAKGLCIILDLHMPEFSGFQVLDALRMLGNTVPVVLCSGRSDYTTQEFADRSGVVALLAKPVDANEFLDIVQSLSVKAP